MMNAGAAILGLALIALPLPASALRTLTPAQVQSIFGTGVAFVASNVGGMTYSMVLNANGTATRTPEGSGNAETGTWRSGGLGYCSKWGSATVERCYAIEQFTATVFRVYNPANRVVAFWTRPAEGPRAPLR